MLRSVILIGAILAALGFAFSNPFAGLLAWAWIALQFPNDEVWGFARMIPSNLIVAVFTIAAWLMSNERKVLPNQFLAWASAVFLAWMTINSFFAVDPAWSWPFWDRTWKTFALGFMVAVLATNRVRIYALVWICVLSLFYYGVKGGLFTIVTGGGNHVMGPPRSPIGDNNDLALALLMTIPLADYLRRQSVNRLMRFGLAAGTVLSVLSVIGSYSRGALIGLGALALAAILRSRHKLLYFSGAAVAVIALLNFMPDKFWERAGTIATAASTIGTANNAESADEKPTKAQTADEKANNAKTADETAGKVEGENGVPSMQERITAWTVAYDYARDHFPFGGGFYSTQLSAVYNYYFPDKSTHAAHSIYFQVLGEHGFPGLFLYLLILAVAFIKCSAIIRADRLRPGREWAVALAQTIQLSLFVFCVAGAALSMAYYDLFVILIGLLVALDESRSIVPAAAKTAQPPSRVDYAYPLA